MFKHLERRNPKRNMNTFDAAIKIYTYSMLNVIDITSIKKSYSNFQDIYNKVFQGDIKMNMKTVSYKRNVYDVLKDF